MIKLNLERLNNHSPYLLWRDDDGDLFFETDEGLLYCLELEDNYETLQYDSCVFGIINKDRKWSHGDNGVLDENIPNYAAIIVERNNPDLDYILQRLDELIDYLKK